MFSQASTPASSPVSSPTTLPIMLKPMNQGRFFKLGRGYFANWKDRTWGLWEDSVLRYYDVTTAPLHLLEQSLIKGELSLKDCKIADGTANIARVLSRTSGQEVAVQLTTSDKDKRVFEVIFTSSGEAAVLLKALGSLGNEAASSFCDSKGWSPSSVTAATPAGAVRAHLDGQSAGVSSATVAETGTGTSSSSSTSTTTFTSGSEATADSQSAPAVTATDNSSLVQQGRVACIVWAFFTLYAAYHPSPMLLLIFSALTGGLVLLLRWGSGEQGQSRGDTSKRKSKAD